MAPPSPATLRPRWQRSASALTPTIASSAPLGVAARARVQRGSRPAAEALARQWRGRPRGGAAAALVTAARVPTAVLVPHAAAWWRLAALGNPDGLACCACACSSPQPRVASPPGWRCHRRWWSRRRGLQTAPRRRRGRRAASASSPVAWRKSTECCLCWKRRAPRLAARRLWRRTMLRRRGAVRTRPATQVVGVATGAGGAGGRRRCSVPPR